MAEGEIVRQRREGRPLLFSTVQELETKLDDYFETMKTTRDIPTITGMAVHLDVDRKTLLNYSNKDEFFPALKRAKAKCEAALESRALLGGLNPAMTIFSLKNNYGWVDKQEVANTHEVVQPILGGLTKKIEDSSAIHSHPDDL